MKNFNLVYKIKKAKTEKSDVVDRLKNGIYLNKKRLLKPLLGCKLVNPLHSYYLNVYRIILMLNLEQIVNVHFFNIYSL